MTTAEDINPFEKVYWNLIQTLAWVHLRTDELVKLADDDVDDWGSHKRELITPDGIKKLVDVANKAPSGLLIELYGSFDGSQFSNLREASESVIKELQIGNIVCYGVPNDIGDMEQIPEMAWADLKFWYEPDITSPEKFWERQGVTKWHKLKFKQAEITKIWPILNTKDVHKAKPYAPRNNIYRQALEKLIELDDLSYGWKRIVELTPGISLNEEGTLVVGSDGFGEPVSVDIKSFQNAFSKMRKILKGK